MRRRLRRIPGIRSTDTPIPKKPERRKVVGASAKIARCAAFPWTEKHARSARGRMINHWDGRKNVARVESVDVQDDGSELWIGWSGEVEGLLGVEADETHVIRLMLMSPPRAHNRSPLMPPDGP